MALKLTPATARDAQPGTVLRDHEVTGLELHVGAIKRTWRLYYRTRAGVERRLRLGYFPEFSLARARELARDMKERVARGEDPSAEFQAARAAPTVNELCDVYLERYAPTKARRSAHEDRLLIEAHIRPGLGSRKVAEVEKADVDAFLRDVFHRRFVSADRRAADGRETAPGAANHVRALLSRMFNLAATDWKMRPLNSNPVQGTARNTMRKRKRLATRAELPRLIRTLDEMEAKWPGHVAATWVLMLTGARPGEVLNAAPEHYDGKHIHLYEHKTVRHVGDRRIYVPAAARRIVEKLPARKNRLFGIATLRKFWDKVRADAELGDLQIRDFRRLFASVSLSTGRTLEQIGEHFGHTDVQTTLGYSWLLDDSDDLVQSVEATAAELLRRGGVLGPSAASPRFRRVRRSRPASDPAAP